MFSISNSSDISQLVIKRQMRNNQSILFLIKSTDRVAEMIDIIKNYSSKCGEIFYNKNIEKPTYDEVQFLNGVLKFNRSMDIKDISSDISIIFKNLNLQSKNMLIETISQVFSECINNRLSKSMITNGYLRCLNTLNNRLSKITYNLEQDNRILYVGKPDKYDILAFTVLGLCGVDVVICDFDEGLTSECMCVNRFILISGQFTNIDLGFLKYINLGISDSNKKIAIANDWVNFKEYKTFEDNLKLLSFNISDRFEKDVWKVIHIDFQGIDDNLKYNQVLDNFMINLQASNRPFVLFDGNILKPTYEEVDSYKKKNIQDIFSIFNNYPIFKNSGVIIRVEDTINSIIKGHNFNDDRKSKNYKDTLIIWLIRILELFYKTSNLNMLPLIVSYNISQEKEQECLQMLSCLPLDILSFSPKYKIAYHTETYIADSYIYLIGNSNSNQLNYPRNAGVGQVATVAYNAEQELNTLLYSDTSLFRIKQFKNVNPIVLKTTYEEVNILWNEPAKFRPSFDSVGDLVTVPTIFEKINGKNETYLQDIKKLVDNKDTLFYQNFPIQLQPSIIDKGQTLRDFVKQLVFKDNVDFERMIKSPYYSYRVYSEETQQLIIDKITKLLSLKWCNVENKNLVYEVLDTLFRLPVEILQKIHNFDFTGDIPKIVIFNGSNKPCNLSDCIILMFLKLIGFDIVIFAPTGYRIIEEYINSQWFNENTIGTYDFNLAIINLNSIFIDNRPSKKSGFFKNFFN